MRRNPRTVSTMRRFAVALAISTSFAALPASAGAAPPSPPPGCVVVVNTPATVTGSDIGFAHKEATFFRLCVPSD
jgi:hypothetical protein